MTRIERSILIQAPVEDVLNYAADWRRWSEWFEGVSDFRPTTAVEQGNGARYAYKARIMGIPAKVETEIHDFIQDSGWTGIATKGMPHKTRWSFESIGDSTKFTYALEYKLPMPLLGSLLESLIMKPQWDRIIRNSLKNLKDHFSSREDIE